MKVNFDYEFKLFHDGVSPPWGAAVNRELEYISLLWGDISALDPYCSYDPLYLDHLKNLGFELPAFGLRSGDQFFWGREEDYQTELVTNSKKTSFHLAQKKNWLLMGEYFTTDVFQVPKGWVAKPIESVSGRGFIFDSKREAHHSCGAILSPWVDRVLDLSCLYRSGRMIFLLNLNDKKGVFRGAVVLEPEKLNQFLKSQFNITLNQIIESSSEIIEEYLLLGARSIQIDSFVYRDSSCRFHYYPLCEVNDRKTMGELAVRLKKKIFNHEEGMVMFFDHNSRSPALSLSPQDSKFKVSLQALDDNALEAFLRNHLGS